jgi:tRNA-splicing ligase RtcB
MKHVITSEKIPIKLWLEDIEDGALSQAKNLANLPFVYKHIAVMPDAHFGYGMPIGGVMATDDVIIPNAVGVDIGCGMCAMQTSLHDISNDKLKQIMAGIRRNIPLGFKHHKQAQDKMRMPGTQKGTTVNDLPVVSREYKNALTQLGTLGGGNHFIEIQKGSDGHIWIMVHSGSRNLGYKVANYYNKLAIDLNSRWGSKIPKNWQLAFLPLSSDPGQQYQQEMQFCVDFALANRKLMMERVQDIFIAATAPVTFSGFINIAHNYAAMETHYRKNVIVHRKGATSAREDELGIIPGSQGTPSYIVRGLGNPESFFSCSHGAGRKMGRKEAQRKLDLDKEIGRLNKQGILHSIRHKKNLDEAAGAYKDIDKVVEEQLDLVEVIVTLNPLAVVKG